MGKMVTLMARRWMGLLLFLIMCLAVSPALADNYEAYRRQHADVPAAREEILLQAASFASAQDAQVLPAEESVETSETGFVEYTVQIPQDALYVVRVRYFPGAGSGGDMLRAFYINGEIPFDEAGELAFSRMWNDANRDYKDVKGNQPFLR